MRSSAAIVAAARNGPPGRSGSATAAHSQRRRAATAAPQEQPASDGVPELWQAIEAHRAHLTGAGTLEPRRAARVGDELVRIVAALLRERAQATGGPRLDDLAAAVAARTTDPWSAAEKLLGEPDG